MTNYHIGPHQSHVGLYRMNEHVAVLVNHLNPVWILLTTPGPYRAGYDII